MSCDVLEQDCKSCCDIDLAYKHPFFSGCRLRIPVAVLIKRNGLFYKGSTLPSISHCRVRVTLHVTRLLNSRALKQIGGLRFRKVYVEGLEGVGTDLTNARRKADPRPTTMHKLLNSH